MAALSKSTKRRTSRVPVAAVVAVADTVAAVVAAADAAAVVVVAVAAAADAPAAVAAVADTVAAAAVAGTNRYCPNAVFFRQP